jgi:hypothetical protein
MDGYINASVKSSTWTPEEVAASYADIGSVACSLVQETWGHILASESIQESRCVAWKKLIKPMTLDPRDLLGLV